MPEKSHYNFYNLRDSVSTHVIFLLVRLAASLIHDGSRDFSANATAFQRKIKEIINQTKQFDKQERNRALQRSRRLKIVFLTFI